jgi:RimJ/RimL family protein N-acetyltransferase
MCQERGDAATFVLSSAVRVLLRQWRDDDRESYAAINADPEVMRYFPSTMSREESDGFIDWASGLITERGWGLWAVEVVGGPPFVGVVGLNETRYVPGAVEVSWKLAREHWGHGYATEAAREALRFGFERLGLHEIVAMTVPANKPSLRVMERLGMTHDPDDDFDRPGMPPELTRHVLYRLRRPANDMRREARRKSR